MSPRQPVVSGERLIKALRKEDWELVRQRGSHGRLKKARRPRARCSNASEAPSSHPPRHIEGLNADFL